MASNVKTHKPQRRKFKQPHGHGHKRVTKVNIMKQLDQTPSKYAGRYNPTNMSEAKEKFMEDGIIPTFEFTRGKEKARQKLCKSPKGQIRLDLFKEAKFILDAVKEKYGDESTFVREAYGPRIDHIRASILLKKYLKKNKLEGEVPIYWAPDLNCSARMMWHGPNQRLNKPEARKYALIIKNTSQNNFMRETGISCLADHELSTHYFRMVNEGMQPWFSNRKKFGLRERHSREVHASEEGLASIHTMLKSKSKFLWGPALLYYIPCKAAEMTFNELFEHLALYVANPEQRWKHVSRVKKCLNDPSSLGGSGQEQVYFEGAVNILRNIDNTDFNLMYAGKVCFDELNRIRRLARMDCVKTPQFLNDIEEYKRTLRHMAVLNGLIPVKRKVSLSTTSRKVHFGRRSKHQARGSFRIKPSRKPNLSNREEECKVVPSQSPPSQSQTLAQASECPSESTAASSITSFQRMGSSSSFGSSVSAPDAGVSEGDEEEGGGEEEEEGEGGMPQAFSQIHAAGLEGSELSLADSENNEFVPYQESTVIPAGDGQPRFCLVSPGGPGAGPRAMTGSSRLLNRPTSLKNTLRAVQNSNSSMHTGHRPQSVERLTLDKRIDDSHKNMNSDGR